MNFSPSKNYLAFLTIERYNIELTNIKISDKNIVPPGSVQASWRISFLLLFWNFADFDANCWVSKKFSSSKFYCLLFNNHHFLTRKTGFRVIFKFTIAWLAFKILILFYKTNFFLILRIMDFQKISNSWSLAYLTSPPGTETVQQISKLWVKYKKSYWDSKMHSSCLNPLVFSIFKLPCQLWHIITFEQVISLCWNFQDNLTSNISFTWKSFIRIWDGLCPKLWNFGPFDMEWPLW